MVKSTAKPRMLVKRTGQTRIFGQTLQNILPNLQGRCASTSILSCGLIHREKLLRHEVACRHIFLIVVKKREAERLSPSSFDLHEELIGVSCIHVSWWVWVQIDSQTLMSYVYTPGNLCRFQFQWHQSADKQPYEPPAWIWSMNPKSFLFRLILGCILAICSTENPPNSENTENKFDPAQQVSSWQVAYVFFSQVLYALVCQNREFALRTEYLAMLHSH